MRIEHSYSKLPDALVAPIVPRPAATPRLLAWNDPLARDLGLERLGSDPDTCAQVFGGGPLPPEFSPVALAYAGHQFGAFVPQLGDGRAVLIGEAIDRNGVRRDIQLKGSGRTPFSRGGDGRSWLGPVLREYLVSEAMHHLDVPTTRALAAVATGESVYRDAELPGAVFTRVAASHIRVGTFEYLAARGQQDALRALTDYAMARHDPAAADAPDPVASFFDGVVTRQAELVAHWMSLGFIHGVMNTDNTSIAGETIDYGPCAFMDEFRADKVFSSIDRHGRYAYRNQPAIAQWNLARLAECLLAMHDARDAYEASLSAFPERYERAYRDRMFRKLGIVDAQPGDAELIDAWLELLERSQHDYTMSFRELAGRIDGGATPHFGAFETEWRQRVQVDGRTPEAIAADMNAVNPLVIPRNHRIEWAIEHAVAGDLQPFDTLRAALAQPFEPDPDHLPFAAPPAPAERVTHTFCGT